MTTLQTSPFPRGYTEYFQEPDEAARMRAIGLPPTKALTHEGARSGSS
jgi:hypothetical protein